MSNNNDGNDHDNVIIPVYWCQVHVDYRWNRKYLLASCFSKLVVKSVPGFGASMKPAPFIIVMGSRCARAPRRQVMKAVNRSHAHRHCPGGVHSQLSLSQCCSAFPPISSDDVKRLQCVPHSGLHIVGDTRWFTSVTAEHLRERDPWAEHVALPGGAGRRGDLWVEWGIGGKQTPQCTGVWEGNCKGRSPGGCKGWNSGLLNQRMEECPAPESWRDPEATWGSLGSVSPCSIFLRIHHSLLLLLQNFGRDFCTVCIHIKKKKKRIVS